jgi:hypothetical protein
MSILKSVMIQSGAAVLVAAALASCQAVDRRPFHVWNGPNGKTLLQMDIHAAANAPLGPKNISEPQIRVTKPGDFVTLQAVVTNPIALRKTAKLRWIWSDASGMTPQLLSSESYHQLNIAPMGKQVIYSTSTVSRPTRVELQILP